MAKVVSIAINREEIVRHIGNPAKVGGERCQAASIFDGGNLEIRAGESCRREME